MSVKLEVGKHYELNNGEVHECTKMNGDDPLSVDHLGFGPFVINECLYHQDGTFADRDATQERYGVKRCVDDPQLWRDMTPEEKGALLLAHHEGKVIELHLEGDYWSACSPIWFEDIAYRVKPEPVVETVTLYGYNYYKDKWTFGSAFGTSNRDRDTHRITFNKIDGKPDCASVKMEEL